MFILPLFFALTVALPMTRHAKNAPPATTFSPQNNDLEPSPDEKNKEEFLSNDIIDKAIKNVTERLQANKDQLKSLNDEPKEINKNFDEFTFPPAYSLPEWPVYTYPYEEQSYIYPYYFQHMTYPSTPYYFNEYTPVTNFRFFQYPFTF